MSIENLLLNYPAVSQFCDLGASLTVPSTYIIANNGEWKVEVYSEEITDLELLKIAAKLRTFDFLFDPREDIYTLNDGKPI